MASYDLSGIVHLAPVHHHVSDPDLGSYTSSYDLVINNCQALTRGAPKLQVVDVPVVHADTFTVEQFITEHAIPGRA
jgi:hypothetical protein